MRVFEGLSATGDCRDDDRRRLDCLPCLAPYMLLTEFQSCDASLNPALWTGLRSIRFAKEAARPPSLPFQNFLSFAGPTALA